MYNAYKPAFPVHGGDINDDPRNQILRGGLTKPERFAMAAMQGLCSNSIPGSHHKPSNLVAEAIEIADKLLKQLEE